MIREKIAVTRPTVPRKVILFEPVANDTKLGIFLNKILKLYLDLNLRLHESGELSATVVESTKPNLSFTIYQAQLFLPLSPLHI